MTKLLDQAMEAVRRLSPQEQDDIARALLDLAGSEVESVVPLSVEEQGALNRSQEAARRGEFATDDEVRAVWAKRGL